MTSVDYPALAPNPGRAPLDRQGGQDAFWAFVDVTLLFLTVAAASDMLIKLGPMQAITWLTCYLVTLLRIGLTLPHFLAMLARNKVVLAYPLICLASVVWSYARGETLVSAIQLNMTMLIAAYLGWRYSLVTLTRCLVIVLTVGSVLSLLHWATGIFPWRVYTEAGGLAGFFQHKNMLGQRALFCITAIVAVLLMQRREIGPLFRFLSAGALLANLLALVLSQSMTSVLLLPAMAGLVLLLCFNRIPGAMAVSGLIALILGVSLGPILLSLAGIDPVGTVLGAVGKDATLTGRTVLWDIGVDVWRENPVLGTGFRAFWHAPEFANGRVLTYNAGARDAPSFHNFVLEILIAVGWPGLIAMVSTIAVCAWRLIRVFALNGSPAAAAGLSLLVGIVITSLVGASLFRAHEIMIVLLIAYTVSAREDLDRLRADARH